MLPRATFVTLSQLPELPQPQFPPLSKGEDNDYLAGLLGGISEVPAPKPALGKWAEVGFLFVSGLTLRAWNRVLPVG